MYRLLNPGVEKSLHLYYSITVNLLSLFFSLNEKIFSQNTIFNIYFIQKHQLTVALINTK